MSNDHGKVPPMTPKTLIIYITAVIVIGLFFFFIRGDLASKICACTFCPAMILYMIYAFFKEQKADKSAKQKNENILDGSYFDNSAWREQYTAYRKEHPFEKPKYTNMKKDLLSRFRRKEYFIGMLFMGTLMLCSFCCFVIQDSFMGVVGILLFGVLFYCELALYIGMPVRKWLKGNMDYDVLEISYRNARMLIHKKNGLAFGTSHIHAFTEKKVFAIEYSCVEGISRKVVRLKKYEDNIYSSEEYQHFAVIHIRIPQNGIIQDVEIELNEFQVQMAIDNLQVYKLGNRLTENMTLEQKESNEFV